MNEREITIHIKEYPPEELTDDDRLLVDAAIIATFNSYSPYSNFSVGAAVLLADGTIITGCNQENASFPVSMCAERSAAFAAGAKRPDVAIVALAIAARDKNGLTISPVTPCGMCRQAFLQFETRHNHPIRVILYGTRACYIVDSMRALLPLGFTEF